MDKENILKAKLDNGKIVEYHLCNPVKELDNDAFDYLGHGVIFSINGKIMDFNNSIEGYFFVKNSKHAYYEQE